ncbi:ABC transporter permease [Labrys wisconsinensis]|uniref:Ribose/xylose/arabinose/galactoside ABC-type transport system permease subunit n=1 Tax=Labrys wisconsinensis TaxID=425677 RepID=A0ABU0JPK8_9HYPH|nr:ABC transporter permease [Labrys wisconsinensis]MDQ0475214.1 ribose/xylose/arabinose/galactoside ABC-type transport system permease subunit [Labrys wisconsinensis]
MSSAAARPTRAPVLVEQLRAYGPAVGMLAVLMIFAVLKPAFFSLANIGNVLHQSVILVVMSFGLGVVMAMRGVDLSVAQIADAAGLLAAVLVLHGQPLWLVLAAPLAFGLLAGLVNGVLAAYAGIPAIIGTLGMMFVIRSGELLMTNGAEPQILFTLPRGLTRAFFFIGQGSIGPVSALVVLGLVVFAAMMLVTTMTSFARRARAIGGNARAAYLAGIDVRAVFAGGFVLAGLLSSIAGVALVSRTSIAVPRGAEAYLLDAFAAVYLGTLLSRRAEITIWGTLIGALFITFLGNGLTLLGLGAPYRFALNGGFILMAMAIGALKRNT